MEANVQNSHSHQHDHGHAKGHGHGYGHAKDRGLAGFLRYAAMLPRMWRSTVSDAVVAMVNPQPGEHVVELGAGMGAAAVVAARTGASITAVDPTPFMRGVLGLRRRMRRRRRNITVVNGAAESIPLPDGAADAIWTVNTMHHWTDLGTAVTEIQRVLRKGGRFLLVDEDFDDPTHPDHALHAARGASHRHHFDVIDPADLAARFQRAGFPGAAGSREPVAGRPCKVLRGTRV